MALSDHEDLLTDHDLLAGRYRLDGLLGTGGMADVHRAWDTLLGRPVAVKVFRPTDEETAGRRFDNEARTLAGLSHPALVPVYDAGQSDGRRFLVLRLLEGRTLRHRINAGPLSIPEVRALGARLAEALAHIHARGVVHRDVKPSNVLLDEDGNALLADFGLARLADSTHLTRADQIVGTAAYLAPEQVRGSEVGAPADVYALGLVLLECLTGQREYEGGEVEAALARLHRPPAVPDDLPADLIRLLRLMTSLSAPRRPSADECAQALAGGEPVTSTFPFAGFDEFADIEVDEPGDVAGEPTAATAKPRRTLHPVLAVAAAVGVAGAIGFAWSSSPGADSEASTPQPTTSATTPSTPSVERVVDTVTVTVPEPAAAESAPETAAAPDPNAAAVPGPGPGTNPKVDPKPVKEAEAGAPAKAKPEKGKSKP